MSSLPEPPAVPASAQQDLQQIEAEARIQKLGLEHEKLQLEKRTLLRQLSFQGIALEWLKASTVPVALVGVFVTFYVGIGQLRLAQESRNSERFESAVTRLSNTRATERFAGVAGLRLFVYSDDSDRQYSALHYLNQRSIC
jgi:hypothetical protein